MPERTLIPAGYSLFQVMGMMGGGGGGGQSGQMGAKIKTPKKSLDQILTPKKSHAEFPEP